MPIITLKKKLPRDFCYMIQKYTSRGFNFRNDFSYSLNQQAKDTVKNNSARRKRSNNGQPLNLFVEYLVVLDSSIYHKYRNAYSQLSNNNELVLQYIKIQFSQLVNSVCYRFAFENTFKIN